MSFDSKRVTDGHATILYTLTWPQRCSISKREEPGLPWAGQKADSHLLDLIEMLFGT